MKKIVKYSNYFGLLLALSAAILFGCRCSTSKPIPDPLAGWRCLGFDPNSVNKAIRDDYQDYIQKLPPDEKGYNIGSINFFEDGTGQHAVNIERFQNTENASWQYALIYDKENKRINVIKYGYRRHMM